MFWWFERGGAYIRWGVSELPGGRYELRMNTSDGTEQVERLENANDLTDRQNVATAKLRSEGWTGPHAWLQSSPRRRRSPRVVGPFEARWRGAIIVPLVIHDLSVGGCLILTSNNTTRPAQGMTL